MANSSFSIEACHEGKYFDTEAFVDDLSAYVKEQLALLLPFKPYRIVCGFMSTESHPAKRGLVLVYLTREDAFGRLRIHVTTPYKKKAKETKVKAKAKATKVKARRRPVKCK